MKGLLGAAALLLAAGVVVSLVMLYGGDRPIGSENLVGKALPDFAAPLASGDVEADANIYTPEQAKAARSVAACDVKLAGAFNSCRDLGGQAILSFWNTTKPECVRQIETIDAFARSKGDVSAAAVAFDQPEGQVRAFVAGRDWKLPVPIDRDGAVAGLYSVAVCPTTYFIANGTIRAVKLGELSSDALAAAAQSAFGSESEK